MLDKLEKISQKINKGIEYVSVVCVFLMTSIVSVQIVTRYIFNFSIPWAEEISKMFMVWFALLCAAILVYEEKHVAVTFIFDRFKDRGQLIITLFFNFCIAAFSIVLIYSGFIYTLDNFFVIMPASGLTRFWIYAPIPIMALFSLYHCVVLIIKTIQQLQGKIPYVKKTWEEEIS